jgi:tRNA A37 methylthiotransferase MiaB
MKDNVPAKIKQRRLQELIDVFREKVHRKNERVETGKLRLVLVEGPTKKQNKLVEAGAATWHGRTDQNKRVLFSVHDVEQDDETGLLSFRTFDETQVRTILEETQFWQNNQRSKRSSGADTSLGSADATLVPGDYAVVRITEAKGHTLRGKMMWKTSLSSFVHFESNHLNNLDPSGFELFTDNLMSAWDGLSHHDIRPLGATAP